MIRGDHDITGAREFLGKKNGLNTTASESVGKNDQRILSAVGHRRIQRHCAGKAAGVSEQGFRAGCGIPYSGAQPGREGLNVKANV